MLQLWAEAMQLYKQGRRWNDWTGNDHVRSICAKVQESASTLPDGFEEIIEFLDIKCPEIGDKIPVKEVKDCIWNTPYYRDTNRIVKNFGSASHTYGFERRKIWVQGSAVWGYVRIRSRNGQ